MEITSLQAYNEACRIVPKRELPPELQARKDALEKELEVLRKHLAYLESDLERMEVMHPGDLGAIAGKREQMTPVKTKITETEKKIQIIYVHPYAEAVWDEAEAIQHHLKSQMQEVYAECYELKQKYLEGLAKIGEIKKISEQVAGEASRVRLDMLPARNPMESIKLSNLHVFTVALGEVEKAFRG